MRVMANVAMVMNLDKCIGCHTCTVTCKQVWTNRPGSPGRAKGPKPGQPRADEEGRAGRHDLEEVIHQTHLDLCDPQACAGRYVLLAVPSVMPHRRARAASPSSSVVSQLTRKLSGAAMSR